VIDMVDLRIYENIVNAHISKYAVYEKIDPNSPNGLYIYDKKSDKWIYIEVSIDYFQPRMDGVYVIYFDNAKCPACRVYDIHWFPYVRLLGSSLDNVYFIVILCNWFARDCNSSIASKTFEHYNVHASPTTILLSVKNGEIVDKEIVEGVKTLDKLAELVESFMSRNGYKV